VWVKIIGIPDKWLTWKTICQISTTLGVLVNIDWQGIFRSFYKEVRVKVSIRDKSKIPFNKLFEMEQCFFLIDFFVENEGEAIDVDEDNDEDPGQSNEGNKLDDDADIGDDFRALDKSKYGGNNSKMETYPSIPHGGRSVSRSAVQQSLETSVQARVFGKEALIPVDGTLVLRSVEENIGKNLLQQFDAESDDDEERVKEMKDDLVGNKPDPPMPSMVWKEKKHWGHGQATRMTSRIPRDGKTVIEKAQDLKKAKNLEIRKGNKIFGLSNSFASLDNPILLGKAKNAGISLGHKKQNVDVVIDRIKEMETKRLDDFHLSNPASFLPSDISIYVE
jgi:hypothetical protein